MTRVFVDATTLVALGQVGALDLLNSFGGRLVIPDAVRAEVTTEPPKTNLDRFLAESRVETGAVDTGWTEQAMDVLGAETVTSDVRLVEGVLDATDAAAEESPGADSAVGLVADDRRLRTVAEGFGATVVGTFGVIVRAASSDSPVSATQAKRIVRRVDSHGLHLTGEMREQAIGSTD
jgi:predicted nucleic acid-binding protein